MRLATGLSRRFRHGDGPAATEFILAKIVAKAWLHKTLRRRAWPCRDGGLMVRLLRVVPRLDLGLALLFAFVSVCRADDHRIIWAVHNAAPYAITDGPDADHGIYDELRLFLATRLDGYTHVTLAEPLPRILSAIKDGKPWRFLGASKIPERENFAYFSVPIGFSYPLGIIIRKERLARFQALGPLSLRTLLQDHRFRTSHLQNRAFTPAIDALLQQYPPAEVHSEVNESLKMLLSDRLDYLLAYASIASYSAKQLGQEGALISLPFKEAPGPVLDHVMCPKTEWGKQVINRIDVILRVERPMPAYRRIVEKWSDQEGVRLIRNFYDTMFLTAE